MALAQGIEAPTPPPCTTCGGTGETNEPHYAGTGARRRQVGEQKGICPSCLGSGTH